MTFLVISIVVAMATRTSVTSQQSLSSHGRALRSSNSSYLCSVDVPSDVIASTRSRTECQVQCVGRSGCWNFNYVAGRCEVFGFSPTKYVVDLLHCKHYTMEPEPLHDVAIVNEFVQLPGLINWYKPVLETLNWDAAVASCRQFHPRSHLVVIDTQDENTAVKNFLQTMPGAEVWAKCHVPFWQSVSLNLPGFWTAGQRLDVDSCGSNFVWKGLKQTSMDEHTWSASPWLFMSDPNCAATYPAPHDKESCVGMASTLGYAWIDIACFYPICPLCELEVEAN